MTTMAAFFCILLVTFTTGTCWAEQNPIASEDVNTSTNDELGIGTSLVDKIIDLALEKLKTTIVEPIALQDEVVVFNKTILKIPLKGELALYNGGLSGIKEIKRSGDAAFKYHNLHEVDVKCSFYFEKLTFQYNFQGNIYNKVSTDGKVDGDIQQLTADATLDIDLRNKSIELTSLSLRTVKSINVSLESEKYVDKLINLVIKVFTSNFKTAILNQIQKELQSLLRQKFYY